MKEAFKKFSTYKEEVSNRNEVWSYTRVSSKKQYDDNESLNNQKNCADSFSSQNDYKITHEFGGTYESAKGDFTRKEFKLMVEEVRKAKRRPYAILIYKMSRFSRSGSGGISVVHELVDDLGVNLIETSSGTSTASPKGKNLILERLVAAERENLERLEFTIPGMKTHLRKGNYLGKAPFGYDHHGPKVKDIERISREQKIVINKEGKLLQQAWKWKIGGMRDFTIIKKLGMMGLKIDKRKLSPIWRNPFYCAVSVNRMLEGDAVKGNWEPMVSEKDFWIVQRILEGNNSGYKKSSVNEFRPLTQFVSCLECDGKLTSYEVKKKGLHYYTCQNKCSGSSMNAISTPNSKKKGLNNIFSELISNYELQPALEEVFRQQLTYSIEAFNEDCGGEEKRLNKILSKLTADFERLQKKNAFDELSNDVFHKYSAPILVEIDEVKRELEKLSSTISNQEETIDKCVEVSKNISKQWRLGDVESKLRIQKLVFPSGLVIDGKKRQYLTPEVNSVFSISRDIARETEGQKKDPSVKLTDESLVVAGARLELTTSGL